MDGDAKMHGNLSESTRNLLERQMIVLWRKPFLTIFYFLMEVLLIIKDCALRLFFLQKIILKLI